MTTREKLLRLDKQLQNLKERQKKLFTRQALSFYRKAKRILKDAFCPELVLVILTHARDTAAAIQKQEEETHLSKEASDAGSSNSETESHHGQF